METGSSSSPQQSQSEANANGQKPNRNNKNGVRVVGNRIYDSENGQTCHQCRQKTRDFCAVCKNPRNGNPCTLRICHKCLLNRYGEKAEEVALLNDWMCPKCRGICNCSLCRKQHGQDPTGMLVHKAKKSGFNSVSDMLSKKASEGLELNSAAVLPEKEATLKKELVLGLSGEHGKENTLGGNDALKVGHKKSKKVKRENLKEISNGSSVNDVCQNKKSKKPKLCNGVSDGEVKRSADNKLETKVEEAHEKLKEEIPLPIGTEITKILDIDLAPEDVGNALQFLEFCRVFGKALDIKKGEAEAVLRALIRKQNLRRGQNTLVVDFQIKLLTFIVSDSEMESSSLTASGGKNSWLKVLVELITESDLVLKEIPLDWLSKGISGYYDLDLSKKLILLNFICDEALGTTKLRSHIDDENERFAEEKKAAKSKVAEAKGKEKSLKQKLQDEIAKAAVSNGANLSVSEHDALLATIKSEAAKAHDELIEAKGTVPKGNQCCDAVRIEHQYRDNSGKSFWKLKSCEDEYVFLLQDSKIEGEDDVKVDEKWSAYGAEQKDEVNKYISSRRDW
ncbi:uncharacterized protein LOC131647387 isoform X1 [Vicia villosa]|uniref:uncharacterized protein LOC131647387 isoform X1 n=1 Tax=Vicia villosa TaxID=3911 RepID=UPI00273CA5BC|nr:uncharacterized protein LOC131647387 isoform X1 [Vicia villosa]